MNHTVYLEAEFLAVVGISLLLPAIIFGWLIRRRKISRMAVTFIGILLVTLSGVDAILLQRLATKARNTVAQSDDRVFASEFSIALYLLPLITAGIGINLLSHVLGEHLIIAELEYDKDRQQRGR